MLTIVVLANIVLSLLCLYAAWRIWRFSQVLSHAANVLSNAEQNTHQVLYGAPEAIFQGQLGVAQLRQRYQQLIPQLQQVRQALTVVNLGLTLWRGGLPWQRETGGKGVRQKRRDRRFSKRS
ncbi:MULTISPECIES: hypothetical protein [unclassified Leptolyngbya]|jgi:hypothetical protein|uniref:hypothetical protein n=1 Tax=unclassified Leptolyngbya TaxID=2650499 RepID=UPI00168977C4|nr:MULTISPECIES: hypothetical protein [unclassified Leptolyngbya]MBD1912630.1 hypothetical protein [Leptolyngbya sp. FACHB-8]MBD2156800.1 hypothetical protein [Leptolyngbya sp. FACHB-16]